MNCPGWTWAVVECPPSFRDDWTSFVSHSSGGALFEGRVPSVSIDYSLADSPVRMRGNIPEFLPSGTPSC